MDWRLSDTSFCVCTSVSVGLHVCVLWLCFSARSSLPTLRSAEAGLGRVQSDTIWDEAPGSCPAKARSRSEGPSLPLQGLRAWVRSDCGCRVPGHLRGHLTRVVLGWPGPNAGLVSQKGSTGPTLCSFTHSASYLSLGTAHCLRSRSAWSVGILRVAQKISEGLSIERIYSRSPSPALNWA